MYEKFLSSMSFTLMILGVLVGVAFFTLLERKILGFIQLRKGPNKVGTMGLLQPFSDAVKLFTKENSLPLMSNYPVYYYAPVLALLLGLILWSLFPMGYNNLGEFHWGALFFFSVTSTGVYTIMISGWASNSSYSLLGGLRAVAQTISYEVSLALLLLYFLGLVKSFSLGEFERYQKIVWLSGVGIPVALSWFASSLAETNRTPFDLAEGESELVSGFNIEYSSGGFALIFMAEYCNILFIGVIFSIICLGGMTMTGIYFCIMIGISSLFIWVRGTFPRFRYDKLMDLAWKCYLPLALTMLLFWVGVSSWVSTL